MLTSLGRTSAPFGSVGASANIATGETALCIVRVLGHLLRGGSHTFMDRVLCTLFGAKAVELISEGRFGRMVAHNGKFVVRVPLAKATGRLRMVPLDEGFVHAPRSLGICLGDQANPKCDERSG